MWKNINQVIQCELLKLPHDFHILLEECKRHAVVISESATRHIVHVLQVIF